MDPIRPSVNEGFLKEAIRHVRWIRSMIHRARADHDFSIARQSWLANGVSIAPTAILRFDDYSVLDIGEGTTIGPYCILDLQSDTRLDEHTRSELIIGQRTAINEFNNIRASNGRIVIGDQCLISQFVSIIAANHCTDRQMPVREQAHDLSQRNVTIGNDVWLGANCVVLPGVKIGDGAIIGAGSIVVSDVPEYVVAAGVPAIVKKAR
jgi:acetyltransferase-like isoleucine patch superfamily enzyme